MNFEKLSTYFLRYSLAASFLSAVADRFGFWGKSGSPGVVWGSFQNFTEYTGALLSFLPSSAMPFFAWSATLLEVILALSLIIGFKIRITALASAALLAMFALSMTISYGFKAPLDYSVFTACTASLLLAFYKQKGKDPLHI